ncbi:MAG TPA: sigma-70 family RNA polymerase sigma factor [Mycobacteriales bacterium]|nr:sigma-70 family RNA polymerase sigma factor [Mycobacteriales bacterium]
MNEVAACKIPARLPRPRGGLGPLSPDAAKLVEQHMSLIPALTSAMVAHYPRHADREELAQAAALGLVEAAIRFDPERGVPFDRWAVTRVRGAVVDAIRAIDFAPRSVRATSRHIEAANDELSQKLGRTPTTKELAATLKMSARELDDHRARRNAAHVLSLDATTTTTHGTQAGLADLLVEADTPTPDAVVDEAESLAIVATAVRLLPARLRQVIEGYFVMGRTSLELADDLGVTESRISQMRAEGLAMLRHALAGPLERSASAEPIGRRAARSRDAYAAAVAEQASALARIPQQRRQSPGLGDSPASARSAA